MGPTAGSGTGRSNAASGAALGGNNTCVGDEPDQRSSRGQGVEPGVFGVVDQGGGLDPLAHSQL